MTTLPKKRGAAPLPRKRVGLRVVSRGDMFVHDDDLSFAEDGIHFHENRTTIMSNFEEWIKLSTDNKITLKNSWQFALIDYFHDLNVIKDGDRINFQRALATLDGCVKIYLSRVESVASETGKLLSGLATQKAPEEEPEPEQEEPKKKGRNMNRVVESTLVPFEQLRIKKLDQELAIDPLFKKALADFDEGGAKSLLLNTLNIDKLGRVVFDATTSAAPVHDTAPDAMDVDEAVDFAALRGMVGAGQNPALCPTLDELKVVLQDVNKAKSVLGGVNTRFLEGEQLPDLDLDIDFEQPEEVVATEPEPEFDELEQPVPAERVLDQDLMAYFDEKMKPNWRGPEHWRVSALKSKKLKPARPEAEAPKRRPKAALFVDFFAPESDDFIEDLFQKAKREAPLKQNTSSHLLPDDIRYNLTRLVNLFLKPHQLITTFKRPAGGYTDENYFAQQYAETEEEERQEKLAALFHHAEMEDCDNLDIDFNDVLGGLDETETVLLPVRRARPETLNFSRVAKRVDVKLLKDNLWRSIKDDAAEERRFTAVVGQIGRMYRSDERRDLLTSFCFICLLHLANEHGLSLVGGGGDLLIKGLGANSGLKSGVAAT